MSNDDPREQLKRDLHARVAAREEHEGVWTQGVDEIASTLELDAGVQDALRRAGWWRHFLCGLAGQTPPAEQRHEPMPARFEPLAVYNAERARGLLHDEPTDRRMAALQVEFDQWWREATS